MSDEQLDLDEMAGEDAAILAVTAHGLLGPVTAIGFAAQLLLERWDASTPDERRFFLQTILERAQFTADVLKDMVRGLPVEVTGVLDGLQAEAERRRRSGRLGVPGAGA